MTALCQTKEVWPDGTVRICETGADVHVQVSDGSLTIARAQCGAHAAQTAAAGATTGTGSHAWEVIGTHPLRPVCTVPTGHWGRNFCTSVTVEVDQ